MKPHAWQANARAPVDVTVVPVGEAGTVTAAEAGIVNVRDAWASPTGTFRGTRTVRDGRMRGRRFTPVDVCGNAPYPFIRPRGVEPVVAPTCETLAMHHAHFKRGPNSPGKGEDSFIAHCADSSVLAGHGDSERNPHAARGRLVTRDVAHDPVRWRLDRSRTTCRGKKCRAMHARGGKPVHFCRMSRPCTVNVKPMDGTCRSNHGADWPHTRPERMSTFHMFESTCGVTMLRGQSRARGMGEGAKRDGESEFRTSAGHAHHKVESVDGLPKTKTGSGTK
jgi:hypothetical protein